MCMGFECLRSVHDRLCNMFSSSRNNNATKTRAPTKISKGFDVRNVFKTSTFSSFPFSAAAAKLDIRHRSNADEPPHSGSSSHHWLPFPHPTHREGPRHDTQPQNPSLVAQAPRVVERVASTRPPAAREHVQHENGARCANVPAAPPGRTTSAEYSIYAGAEKNTFVYQRSVLSSPSKTDDTYSILSEELSSSGSSSSLTAEPAFSPTTTSTQSPELPPTELRREPPGDLHSYQHGQQNHNNYSQPALVSSFYSMPDAPLSHFTSLPSASTDYTMPEDQLRTYNPDDDRRRFDTNSYVSSRRERDYASGSRPRSRSPEERRNARASSSTGDSGYHSNGSESHSRSRNRRESMGGELPRPHLPPPSRRDSTYVAHSRSRSPEVDRAGRTSIHSDTPLQPPSADSRAHLPSRRSSVRDDRYGNLRNPVPNSAPEEHQSSYPGSQDPPSGEGYFTYNQPIQVQSQYRSRDLEPDTTTFSSSESTFVPPSPPPVPYASRPASFSSLERRVSSSSPRSTPFRQAACEGGITIATVLDNEESTRIRDGHSQPHRLHDPYSTHEAAHRPPAHSEPPFLQTAREQLQHSGDDAPRTRTPRARSHSISASTLFPDNAAPTPDIRGTGKSRAKSVSPERRFFTDRPQTDAPRDMSPNPALHQGSVATSTLYRDPRVNELEAVQTVRTTNAPFHAVPSGDSHQAQDQTPRAHAQAPTQRIPNFERLSTPVAVPFPPFAPTGNTSLPTVAVVSHEHSISVPAPPAGNTGFRQPRVSFSEPHRRRSAEDALASGSTHYDEGLGEEPARRHSDGEEPRQFSSSRRVPTSLINTARPLSLSVSNGRGVRWSENLICPSPIFACDRRKGWFNSRGDQLWTNEGAYKPPASGEEYPPQLADYPPHGQGWMNEDGVRIDMRHRLIPKPPLRPALKRGRSSETVKPLPVASG